MRAITDKIFGENRLDLGQKEG